MPVILFRNLNDKSWKYSVISKTLTKEELKTVVDKDLGVYSFHGVYDDHRDAMKVSENLDQIYNQVSHQQLNPDTQHMYDGEEFGEY